MTTEDVLLQHLGIDLLALWVIAGEPLLVVGDEDTAIASTLHGTEHTRARRRALETDVKVTFERSGSVLIVQRLGHGDVAIWLGDTLVLVSEAELGQGTTSNEETSSIGYPQGQSSSDIAGGSQIRTGCPVGQTVVNPVAGKFF